MPAPDISAVICTYNRAATLRIALESLINQDTQGAFTYEVIVVNDRSTDDTPQVIEEIAARAPVPVRVVAGEGLGVAAARNAGMQAAQGNWIAYTDDDQRNEPRWLLELWLVAQRTLADCVGGAVDLDLSVPPEVPLTPVTAAILGYKHNPEARIDELMRCPGTGNIMLARHVFDQLGGFESSLEWGGEDYEFMLRFVQTGLTVWFAPKSVVWHIIPPYRTRREYFRWASRRVGVAMAEVDCKVRGKRSLVLRCVGRLVKSVIQTLPKLLYAGSRGDAGRVLEAQCLLWRTNTYVRHTMHLLAPRLFPQRGFYASLNFRAERDTMAKE